MFFCLLFCCTENQNVIIYQWLFFWKSNERIPSPLFGIYEIIRERSYYERY